MYTKSFSRREFIKKNSLTGIGVLLASSAGSSLSAFNNHSADVPALLGGAPVHTAGWPQWPYWNPSTDEKRVLEPLRSGARSRGKMANEFEQKYAQMMGAKRCLAIANGTSALVAALTQADIGGGDEVIIPPYTFIATPQSVLMTGAMPVFADIDLETFQIDPKSIEKKITPRTRAIMPVHVLGFPADMPTIMAIARKHNLVVIEDACQAWLAEINHKKVGTFGKAGCFSFQNSKHLSMGEGGAIVSDDDDFMDRCNSFHRYGGSSIGTNMKLTDYQAAVGLAMLARLEEETVKRNENAIYLKEKIEKIPGIVPVKPYDHVTRAVFHLFAFRYQKDKFQGLSRDIFLKALNMEGIPCSSGYSPLNKMPYLANAFQTKNFRKMYSKKMLDINTYNRQNECPENDRLCNEEAIWLTQNMLLAGKQDMDDIVKAIEKIRQNAGKLKNHKNS
jgi:dTDP-4-amino-4,6-dideoxygalactose transaminase